MAQTVVADAALAFKALHPGVKLSIRADYSATAVANIALMEADIGVLYHSVSHPAINGERSARVEQFMQVCRNTFHAFGRTSQRQAMLDSFRCPTFRLSDQRQQDFREIGRNASANIVSICSDYVDLVGDAMAPTR